MECFQLRLRNGMSLGNLAGDIAHGIWKVLGWHPEFDDLDASHFIQLDQTVREVLAHHVFRYDRCGSDPVCDEDVTPAEWNRRETAATPAFHEDEHLIMEVESDLRDVVSDMESALMKNLFTRTEHAMVVAPVIREIKGVMQRVMGPYLFANPSCGALDLCKARRHVSPWGGRARTA